MQPDPAEILAAMLCARTRKAAKVPAYAEVALTPQQRAGLQDVSTLRPQLTATLAAKGLRPRGITLNLDEGYCGVYVATA